MAKSGDNFITLEKIIETGIQPTELSLSGSDWPIIVPN